MHLKTIEDFVNNLTIFFESTASDENVIKINSSLALDNKVSED
jgi:hypothetical protein